LDDIDSLLEIVESSKERVKFEDTDVEKFIREKGIKEGSIRISSSVIYYDYFLWKNKRNYRNRRMFFKQFNKHFKTKPYQGEVTYLLDGDSFNLSKEWYFKARAFLRRERDEQQRKKEKTKPKKQD